MKTYAIGIMKYAMIMSNAFVGYYQGFSIKKDKVIIDKITNNKIINCGGIPIKNVKRINGYDKDHNLRERFK